jgi:copper resistance protein B
MIKNSVTKIALKKMITRLLFSSVSLTSVAVYSQEQPHAHSQQHAQKQPQKPSQEHMHDHGDNPVIAKLILDKFEVQDAVGENPLTLEAQAWIGTDLNKFWLKTDIEQRDGSIAEAEVQALYSRAIAPYWDLQMGIRQDLKPAPSQHWGVLGIHGLAPYFFEIDTALFIGDGGKTALRFSAEYECLFTQKLILAPEISLSMYGQNDWQAGTAAGLSELAAGLRLRYEIKREFAPYVGLSWNKSLGATADMARSNGESAADTRLVAGLRIWF